MGVGETRRSAVRERRWSALGTSVHLLVRDPRHLAAAAAAVARVLEVIDLTCSRFRDDSELSAVNRAAGREIVVGPLLAQAVHAALRAAAATDGAVDPTLGRSMRAIGYDADFTSLAARAGAPTIRLSSTPGWSSLRFDPARRTLRLPRGVELDLGSTGKALAADLAAQSAAEGAGGAGVLVNLGGDIAVAGEPPREGWRIGVADDAREDPTTLSVSISIRSGGVATSSTTVRRWIRGGVERHHIVDPGTGLPAASPWRTATVVSADCVTANAASTAAIVKGPAAPAWLDGLGLPARLVASDGSVVVTRGWPAVPPERRGAIPREVAA